MEFDIGVLAVNISSNTPFAFHALSFAIYFNIGALFYQIKIIDLILDDELRTCKMVIIFFSRFWCFLAITFVMFVVGVLYYQINQFMIRAGFINYIRVGISSVLACQAYLLYISLAWAVYLEFRKLLVVVAKKTAGDNGKTEAAAATSV